MNRVERLLSPEMVAEIMSISKRKAYDVMNSIPHIARPLRVPVKRKRRAT